MKKKTPDAQTRQYTKLSDEDKKNFISALFLFASRHFITLALALFFLMLVIGGYFGWRYYQYRQSDVFAFAGFSSALHPPKADQLAKIIDFNTLSEHLARVIARNYPFLKQGPNQQRDLKNMIQTHLLQRVMTKEDPAKPKPDPQKLLQTPLAVLPDDFLTQFTKNLAMRTLPDSGKENSVLLSTSVEHPLLERTFPILLRMDNTGDGWIVRDIANADELVGQFREAQMKRMTARHDELVKKIEAASKRMNGIIPLQSCSAGAKTLSDGKTLLLVTNVLARNTASQTVNSTNLEAVFTAENGEELLRRYLNAAQPVKPGEDYNGHWTIELDAQSPLGERVLNSGEISCAISWRSMGLSNGEVLHASDPPEMVEDFK